MAKETIERIREAEKAAAQSQSDAKREAEKQIADAGKKAKELEEGIVAKARDEEKESEKVAQAEAEKIMNDALGGADGEIADIESKARARMPEAVKAVVKMITE